MSLRKAQICGLWALGALAIGLQGARAQEPPPAGVPAAEPASTVAPGDRSGAQDSPRMVRTAATSANTAGPPTVCFKFTMRCFGGSPTSADSAQASSAQTSSAKPPSRAATNGGGASSSPSASGSPPAQTNPLNLTPPDVRTVIPLEELREPLPTEDQQEQQTEASTVEVQSDSDTPNVPGGFGALFWALRHPTKAWRIFTPVE